MGTIPEKCWKCERLVGWRKELRMAKKQTLQNVETKTNEESTKVQRFFELTGCVRAELIRRPGERVPMRYLKRPEFDVDWDVSLCQSNSIGGFGQVLQESHCSPGCRIDSDGWGGALGSEDNCHIRGFHLLVILFYGFDFWFIGFLISRVAAELVFIVLTWVFFPSPPNDVLFGIVTEFRDFLLQPFEALHLIL